MNQYTTVYTGMIQGGKHKATGCAKEGFDEIAGKQANKSVSDYERTLCCTWRYTLNANTYLNIRISDFIVSTIQENQNIQNYGCTVLQLGKDSSSS